MSNISATFLAKATKVFEQQKMTFTLGVDTPGVSFTHNELRLIPAGKYTVIEADNRDNTRYIILNTKTFAMYAISKKMIPHIAK